MVEFKKVYNLSDQFTAQFIAMLARWVNDPRNRMRLNAPARNVSQPDVASYLNNGKAANRYFAGIQHRTSAKWIGMYEVTVDPRHLNASVEAMLDLTSPHLDPALSETLPALTALLAAKGLEKAIAKVPETDAVMLRHLPRASWTKEAHLRLELKSWSEAGQRLDLIQFGKVLVTSI